VHLHPEGAQFAFSSKVGPTGWLDPTCGRALYMHRLATFLYKEKHVNNASNEVAPSTKQEEWRSFLFLTAVMAPLVTVGVVAGWGFIVWMYQLITGDLPG